MSTRKKTLEETYTKYEGHEHVLARPGMYIGDISKVIDVKSQRTVRRYIKELKYLTSYTHKGRYYTLEETLSGIEAILAGNEAPKKNDAPAEKPVDKKPDDTPKTEVKADVKT